jgi:putative redox protein
MRYRVTVYHQRVIDFLRRTPMAETIRVAYEGHLRCKAGRGASGQAVLTDVDAEHGGQGEYLTPVEMTVAALGACAISMLSLVAERDGIDVSGARATADFEMATAPPRRIGAVRLTLHLPGSVPEAKRAKLEAAAKACPVRNSLHPDVWLDLAFAYGDG